MNDDLTYHVIDEATRHYDFSDGYGTEWTVALDQTDEERMNGRWEPMMNTLWPLPDEFEAPDDAKDALDNMTIVEVKGEYHLALTGGGMDMSWQIARTYIGLGLVPPTVLGDLPEMAGMDYEKPMNAMAIRALKKSHEAAISRAERSIEKLDRLGE